MYKFQLLSEILKVDVKTIRSELFYFLICLNFKEEEITPGLRCFQRTVKLYDVNIGFK